MSKAMSLSDVLTEMIKELDLVSVVRCRDCKWFGDVGCAIMIADDSDKPTGSDYCSFGERGGQDDE